MIALFRWVVAFVVVLLLVGAFSAQASSIDVPSSGLSLESSSINAKSLKPPACDTLNLTNTVSGIGLVNGTSGNDLLLGSSLVDTMNGMAGNDCIVGGDGVDIIFGGSGYDVCIGGPGVEIFDVSCEVQIQ